MNSLILFAMAVLGIGGGLAGLWYGWRESIREAYSRRIWASHRSTLYYGGRIVAIAGPVEPHNVPASSILLYLDSSVNDRHGIFLAERWPA